MIKNEWKNLLHNKIMFVVVIAIIAIPIIYAGLFLKSMWDPYGSVDHLPVAVVNEDKPVDYDGTTLSVGKDMVEELRENDSMAFNFVDSRTVEDGLENGTYYMVITIPEDFSANAATLMDDEPKKMELKYETNPGTNYIASKLSETALLKIKDAVATKVTETYTQTVFDQIAKVGDGMQDAADGSGELTDGIESAAKGNQTITENLKKLSSSTLTFADGAETLTKGIQEYTDGVSQVNEGARQLDDGVSTLTAKVPELTSGIDTLNSGVKNYTDGVAKLNENSEKLKEGASALESGINSLSAGVTTLADGATQYINGANSLADGTTAYVKGAGQEGIVSPETSGQIREILEKVVSLGSGKNAGIQGYHIGGKTATSQTLPRSSCRYISSFLGFAPAENPQVLGLCIIHDPKGVYYGGTVAAPVIRSIFENILPYLGIEKTGENSSEG